ncbi:efflux RND transporter periplasmic adaptor subunit [Prolixibacteraceae bacterium JC049]|nr:efflux RND transporter periplasmic adaptor subunit [Prolixibacteraceae bacterium JC049]
MKQYLGLLLIAGVIGCTATSKESKETADKRHYQAEENLVDTIILKSKTFKKQLVSNGKLKAQKKSELRFKLSENLEQLTVKNGMRVNSGDIIAQLNDFNQKQRMEKARLRMEQAELDLEDKLISQGYKKSDANIPEQVMKVAKVRAGYYTAEEELKSANYELKHTKLVAPFAGKLANVKHKVFENVSSGDVFCMLIDDSAFEVEFSVLETELKDIKVGHTVKVVPFSDHSQQFEGAISEVNPVVEKNGLVKAKAIIKNPGSLLEGMNVKVLIESELPNMLVVPKTAVVLRQNLEVLFRCKRDTVARWTYVHTTNENSTEYTIVANTDRGASISAGDTIIVSGNLNLADDANVKIK